MESPGDRPVFDPGDIIESPNGDLCVKIIDHIGEGRCCMVYSATTIRDNSKVALKVFKKGPTYDGAVQREQYILDIFNDPKHNIGMLKNFDEMMIDFVRIEIKKKSRPKNS